MFFVTCLFGRWTLDQGLLNEHVMGERLQKITFSFRLARGAFTTGEAGTLGPGAGAVVRKTAQRAGKGFPGWVWFWKRLLCMSRIFLGRPYEQTYLSSGRVSSTRVRQEVGWWDNSDPLTKTPDFSGRVPFKCAQRVHPWGSHLIHLAVQPSPRATEDRNEGRKIFLFPPPTQYICTYTRSLTVSQTHSISTEKDCESTIFETIVGEVIWCHL